MIRRVGVILFALSCAAAQQGDSVLDKDSASNKNDAIPVFELDQPEPAAGVKNVGVAIDPILLVNGKQIQAAPYACDSDSDVEKEEKAFDDRYLRPGTRYRVVYGGREAGTAIVRVPEPNAPGTNVDVEGGVSVHGITMALAVGPGLRLKSEGLRRDPTAAELDKAKQIVRTIFASHGTHSSDLERLTIDQATVIEVESGIPEIAVSAEITRTDKYGMEYSLFLTSQLDGGTPSVIWYQKAQSETEAQAVYIVDLIDLDGDGVNELVARRAFYENYDYEVYKKRNGKWELIFKTDILGCL